MTYGVVDDKSDSKDPQARLAKMKADVERTNIYWKPNAKRFHQFQRFCFKTAISESDKSSLNQVQKPILEFNIVNAPLSRQCGEFSKQEPSIEVSAKAGKKVDPQIIEFLDGHIRYILDESKKRNTQYNVYRDSMSGGFSNFKITTDYEDELSFDQIIKVSRSNMPTMIGYDPMAREADKSDAEFYFELFPMEIEQFKSKYPKIPLDQLDFLKSDGSFSWSFKNQDQKVIILADYYRKVRENKTIVRLANQEEMLKTEYEEELKKWESESHIEQPRRSLKSARVNLFISGVRDLCNQKYSKKRIHCLNIITLCTWMETPLSFRMKIMRTWSSLQSHIFTMQRDCNA